MENIHYAVLDIGTTSIRCFVYNQKFDIISSSSKDIKVLIPKTGYHEIDHEEMFQDVLYVIRESVKISGLSFDQIVLGISVQRSTFTTWSKSSGKYFHNFITWKDIRADAIVNKWNLSYRLGLIKFSSKCVHALTQSSRFLAGSVIKLMNSQVVPRLLWVVENNLNVKDSYKGDDLVMGTIDSYLLQRLRSGSNNEMHEVIEPLIEVTNATVTGIFDPFTVSWANWIMSLFSLKPNIFPKIAYNSDDFGEIHESYFGTKVKIVGIMGDQPASMFGNCCFNRGDAKITLGKIMVKNSFR
jgi:putative glycerol kinase 5